MDSGAFFNALNSPNLGEIYETQSLGSVFNSPSHTGQRDPLQQPSDDPLQQPSDDTRYADDRVNHIGAQEFDRMRMSCGEGHGNDNVHEECSDGSTEDSDEEWGGLCMGSVHTGKQADQELPKTIRRHNNTQNFFYNVSNNARVLTIMKMYFMKLSLDNALTGKKVFDDRELVFLVDTLYQSRLVALYREACANDEKCVWYCKAGEFTYNGRILQIPTYGMGVAACSMPNCRNQRMICLGCLITCICGYNWDRIVCMGCRGGPPIELENQLAYEVVMHMWEQKPADSVYRTPDPLREILKWTSLAQVGFALINVMGNKARLPKDRVEPVQRDSAGHVMIMDMNFMTYLDYNGEECFPIWRTKTVLQSFVSMFAPLSVSVSGVGDHSILGYIDWILAEERALYAREPPSDGREADNLLGTFMFQLVYSTVPKYLVERMDFARWIHKHAWYLFYVFNPDMIDADLDSARQDPSTHGINRWWTLHCRQRFPVARRGSPNYSWTH